MPETSPDEAAWRDRIDSMISADVQEALKILEDHGFTSTDALAAMKRRPGIGLAIALHKNAPKEFDDPTYQCYYALRILLLADDIRQADPRAVQIGRLWGRAGHGLQFPAVAKAMEGWWLRSRRGPGGAKTNDLTRTLGQIFKEEPGADRKHVLDYLQSDQAQDDFSAVENPKIHVTGVAVSKDKKWVTYEDRARKAHKIAMVSLDKKLRTLRPK